MANAERRSETRRAFVRDLREPRRALLSRSVQEAVPLEGGLPLGTDDQAVTGSSQALVHESPEHGFNAAIVSLVGSVGNGGPSDDGSSFDGLRPFIDGSILNWQEPYWQRVTAYLRMAADYGITMMLYPIDGWTIGRSFIPKSIEQCHSYGRKVAERLRDLPNIIWMSGGDYIPATKDSARGSDVDHGIDAMMRGIREAGDGRPFSIQLAGEKSISNDNAYWASRVDWNFVYTYYPTYRAVLEA